MSFFSSSSPEEAMGTSKEREQHISKIISFLGLSTIGELIWLQRTLESNFQQRHLEASSNEINIYEQKKQEMEQLLAKHQSLISEMAGLQEKQDSTEQQINELQSELEIVSSEKETVETERDFLSRELERVGNLYTELTGRQAKQEELQEIFGIYITLMEDVFSGRAHFKILSILHGEKTKWTREELVKSTGVSDIMLRTVLGDLERAKLILYDREATSAQLLQRISSLE